MSKESNLFAALLVVISLMILFAALVSSVFFEPMRSLALTAVSVANFYMAVK